MCVCLCVSSFAPRKRRELRAYRKEIQTATTPTRAVEGGLGFVGRGRERGSEGRGGEVGRWGGGEEGGAGGRGEAVGSNYEPETGFT